MQLCAGFRTLRVLTFPKPVYTSANEFFYVNKIGSLRQDMPK
jgi:hypothetical protein